MAFFCSRSFFCQTGLDVQFDGGLTLAFAFWSRSAVLLELRRGADALVDIQCAIDNGYDAIKTQLEYYIRLARANASMCVYGFLFIEFKWSIYRSFDYRECFTN